MSGNFDQFLSHFRVAKRQGDKAICHCPTHDDKRGSLHFTLDQNMILGYCFAGCQLADILAAVNLKLSDLFLNGRHSPKAIYQYRTKEGGLAYEKLKYRAPNGDKTFKQRRVDAEGKIIYDLKDIQRIPYNYPGVLKAIKRSEVIIWTEGEKDAETARILGYSYTTMGGASDWKDEWKDIFYNGKIGLVSDKDKPGINLVQNISKSLTETCKSVKVVILPQGKDLTDWVTLGHGRIDFDKLIMEAPELVKPSGKPKRFQWQDYAITHNALLEKELEPIDFIIDEILVSVGTGVLAGRKKSGKSFMGIQIGQAKASSADFLGRKVKQGSVVYFALEDGERRTQARLKQQNAIRNLPITYFYTWPAWNTGEGYNQLRAMLVELKPSLVIVDTFAKCLNGKPDQNSAGEMADFGNRMHDLALEVNTMILFIAHHGKMSTRDPGFDIRGSSAIPSSTDVNIGLYKNEDGTFDLIGEGRDIEEFDLRIKLDKEITWAWQYEGEAQDIRREQAEQSILDAMASLGGEKIDCSQISEETGTTRVNVNTHLKRMRDYENPPVTYQSQGKRIVYTLTSLTTLTNQ